MKLLHSFIFILTLTLFAPATLAYTPDVENQPHEEYLRAKVLEVQDLPTDQSSPQPIQKVLLEITSAQQKGEKLSLEYGRYYNSQPLTAGQTVALIKTIYADRPADYQITDTYRIPAIVWIFGLFFLLVILISRFKGFGALFGLAISIFILGGFVVPQIMAGRDPLLISLIGSLMIACLSIYLAHGFHKSTTLALISTLISLSLAALLSIIFVKLAGLSGGASEEAFFLQVNSNSALNLRGLLLGGILIGTLGVLDDVTTAQTAAIQELKKANSKLQFYELYQRGLKIGREHISSLTNTLVLAYAGSSLPLFILFTINKTQPFWFTLNSEFVAEEIIRTLVGSITLVLAVPITTALAAYIFAKQPK